MQLLGNLGNKQIRGIEPQTQQDIVDEKYPSIGFKTVTFTGDKLPALKEGFKTEESLAQFILNTARMRRVQIWQFTLFNPENTNAKWEKFLTAQQVSRLASLQAKAYKAAEVMFSSQSCAGIRLSVEGGLEVAHVPQNTEEEYILTLTYKVT